MVIWLRLTFKSFEFWSAKASWLCVSWYSPRVLCTCPPLRVVWVRLQRLHSLAEPANVQPSTRLVNVLLAVAFFALAAPAAAAPPIMPLSEVRSGMRCTGLSVVRGTAISSFNVDVIDVVAGDASTDTPKILVRASGPAVDATGIGFGFSGSPILCPDSAGVRRTAGAISETRQRVREQDRLRLADRADARRARGRPARSAPAARPRAAAVLGAERDRPVSAGAPAADPRRAPARCHRAHRRRPVRWAPSRASRWPREGRCRPRWPEATSAWERSGPSPTATPTK